MFTSVATTTINGYEAAKVVHERSGDGIRGELDPQPSTQPKGWLDNIALSFRAITPDPFPSPPPSPGMPCS